MKTWFIKRLVIPFILALGSIFALVSPVCALEEDFQQWNQITAQGKIKGKLLGYMEVQGRFADDFTEFDRLLLRPALGWEVKPNLSVWQGYVWTPGFEPRRTTEHRLWQQVQWEQAFSKLTVDHRLRMEERFIEDAEGMAGRIRYQLGTTVPLGKCKKWYLRAYNEIFFNLNSPSGGPQAGFDQNRLFTGLGRHLSKNIRLEGGYMTNLVNRTEPVDRFNHVVLLTLRLRF